MPSGNVFIDGLAVTSWLAVGRDRHITYYFDDSGVQPWSAFTIARYEAALQQWAAVADITMERVFSPAGADFTEKWVTQQYMLQVRRGDFGGYHFIPNTSPPGIGEYNANRPFWTPLGAADGGLGFHTLLHELGHGLGFMHPHDDTGGKPKFPGVVNFDDPGPLGYNQDVYTLMSYNPGPFTNSGSVDYGRAMTPMAFDIAAMQFLYGANTTYRAGHDTYVVPDANAPGTGWRCIWDTGGTDTIRYDGAASLVIDLRAATLVNGDPNAGGFISWVPGIFGGITIANGVVIENAFGGGGNDTLLGNAASNGLYGGPGNDTLIGGLGADGFLYSSGADTFLDFIAGPSSGDRVDFATFGGALTLADVLSRATQVGADTVIDFSGGNSITLKNVNRNDLNADDFHGLGGGLPTPPTPPAPPAPLPPAGPPADKNDFNGDGRADILWQNDNGTPGIWLMDGFVRLAGANVGGFNPGSSWKVKDAGDFNSDGRADILWQNLNGTAGIWLMDGLTVIADSGVGSNPGPSWKIKDSGDFNGDGRSDILWQNDNGTAAIWLMNGLGVHQEGGIGFNPGPSWKVKAAADFNGDGKADILWQNDNGAAGIWLMDGLVKLADSGIGFNPGPSWKIKDAGDFNADGRADILWQNDNGTAGIWLMDGFTQLAGANVGGFNPGPTWKAKSASDVNGDGRADILWQNDNGAPGLWLMDGLSVIAESGIGFNPGPAWKIIEHADLV